jgi:phenylpyruvate tautomerase PptA (4-oxalocrotonate tautomerase family)
MPTIYVTTNATVSQDVKQALLKELDSVVVKNIGKPLDYSMIIINDNVTSSFGGNSQDPTAFIVRKSYTSNIVANNFNSRQD